jgi:AraC-like DNA-binding protein
MHAQMAILRDVIYGATARGGDFIKMCDELGFAPHELNESDRLVPFESAAKAWDVVVQSTKDKLLGLHLGEELSPTILGMVGYLMQNCPTILGSFIWLEKYWSLISTMAKFEVEETHEQVLIHKESALAWQHQYPESARQSVEISMSGILTLAKFLTGKKILPVRVEFAYPSRSLSEYERIFQSPIQFNAKSNTLTFRNSDFLLPVVKYDKSLFEFFNKTLEQKLGALKKEERVSDQLKQMILNDFKGRTPSIEIAASKLNMTARSLQRKLKDDGTGYREIVKNLKKDLAQTILAQPEFRVGEVAEILGYSDSSSFRKAYKKWAINN